LFSITKKAIFVILLINFYHKHLRWSLLWDANFNGSNVYEIYVLMALINLSSRNVLLIMDVVFIGFLPMPMCHIF